MLRNTYKAKRDQGFTIIEVMIVLAIAGLIMLIVLIAIPQLQRNQRNTARKDILGRIKTEIDSYAGNNNGKIPTLAADLTGFTARYLNGVNIEDPKTGTPTNIVLQTDVAGAIPTSAATGTAGYVPSRTCNGEQLATGSARQYAIFTKLEGDAIFCLDNK